MGPEQTKQKKDIHHRGTIEYSPPHTFDEFSGCKGKIVSEQLSLWLVLTMNFLVVTLYGVYYHVFSSLPEQYSGKTTVQSSMDSGLKFL